MAEAALVTKDVTFTDLGPDYPLPAARMYDANGTLLGIVRSPRARLWWMEETEKLFRKRVIETALVEFPGAVRVAFVATGCYETDEVEIGANVGTGV